MKTKNPPRKIYTYRFSVKGVANLEKVAKTADTSVVELLRRAACASYGVEL